MTSYHLSAKPSKSSSTKLNSGFTLIEIMIVVAIIGIISAIAYPSYSEQVKRGKRTDGKDYLLDIASAQEAFYAQNLSYASSVTLGGANGLNRNATSTEGHYTVVSVALPAGCSVAGTKCRTYTLTATPTFNDAKCTTITYDNAGVKGFTGTGPLVNDCWR